MVTLIKVGSSEVELAKKEPRVAKVVHTGVSKLPTGTL